MQPVKIAVYPAEHFSRYQRLWEGLSDLYSVEFHPREEGNWGDCAAGLLFSVERSKATAIAKSGLRCMAFIGGEAVATGSQKRELSFGGTPYLAECLRGRTWANQSIEGVRPLKAEDSDEVVARTTGDVLWIHNVIGDCAVDLVAVEPPAVTEDQYLYEFFQRDNCMRLLPLLHFLRQLTPWTRPALRACFMFDDPNLHWKTYGYIKFDELAGHARVHNYHASFATVPFDGWYVNPATAAIFRHNRDRLSLLVHGNNHTFAELAREYPNGDRCASMAQAQRRIDELEKRSGLEIPRVMAAPHGGCSAEMADTLLEVGFEAASISRWSLMHFNRERWYSTIGLNIAEFLGGAFPIIPRFKLAWEREIDIYLAALLQKPIILVGHHDDLRGGLDILSGFAQRINSVGRVQWVDMKAMARSNFCTRSEGTTLYIKTYSRRMQIQVPENTATLVVERPWLKDGQIEVLQYRTGDGKSVSIKPSANQAIPVTGGTQIEVASVYPDAVDPATVPAPSASVWAAARRGFCEIRDRAKPFGSLIRSGHKV